MSIRRNLDRLRKRAERAEARGDHALAREWRREFARERSALPSVSEQNRLNSQKSPWRTERYVTPKRSRGVQ
jgi:hypothetical protein